jgi:hypothetical protein
MMMLRYLHDGIVHGRWADDAARRQVVEGWLLEQDLREALQPEIRCLCIDAEGLKLRLVLHHIIYVRIK